MAVHSASNPVARRFTRSEYRLMAEAQLFSNERVELLDGIIVSMSPQKSLHASTVHRILRELTASVGADTTIRVQAPIILDDWSEPEPDLAVCLKDPDEYPVDHPRAREVLLVIEVADTSLAYDRGQKAPAYAASNIPLCCIVNLVDRVVEICQQPDPGSRRYVQVRIAHPGERLVLPFDRTVDVACFFTTLPR